MLAEGLYSLLAASASLQAILGTPGSRTDKTTGIFPVEMPESADAPAIVLTQIAGGAPAANLDGAEALHTARVQFSCYGRSYGRAKGLATTLRRILEGYKSGVNGQPATLADGTAIGTILLSMELDSFEEAPFLYHCPVDFEIWYHDTGDFQSPAGVGNWESMGPPNKIVHVPLFADHFVAVKAPIACNYWLVRPPEDAGIIRASDPNDADTYFPIPAGGWSNLDAAHWGPPRYAAGDTVMWLKAVQGTGPAIVEFIL